MGEVGVRHEQKEHLVHASGNNADAECRDCVRRELRNEITAAFKKISEALKNIPTLKRFDEQAQDDVKISRPATTHGGNRLQKPDVQPP